MVYEKLIVRENGDIVKITTILSGNVFLECGYEQEQFASVKNLGSDGCRPLRGYRRGNREAISPGRAGD